MESEAMGNQPLMKSTLKKSTIPEKRSTSRGKSKNKKQNMENSGSFSDPEMISLTKRGRTPTRTFDEPVRVLENRNI